MKTNVSSGATLLAMALLASKVTAAYHDGHAHSHFHSSSSSSITNTDLGDSGECEPDTTEAASTIATATASTTDSSTTLATVVPTSSTLISSPLVSSTEASIAETSSYSSPATTVAAVADTSSYISSTSTVASATETSSTSEASSTSSSPVNLAWKAGLSGYPGIESLSVFNTSWAPYISWYSNYNPIAPDVEMSDHTVIGAPMLWGKGDMCLTGPDGPVDQYRMDNFTSYVKTGETSPQVFFGFYEPDCNCSSSSEIPDVTTGVDVWNDLIAPLGSDRGIPLGSPSMCTQLDQTWLTSFSNASVSWDITSIHVNKPTSDEAKKVVEYYASFGKPVWVTELTCVDDKTWSSCGDQSTVNGFIDDMVEYLEGNGDVIAYGANNGEGVPGVWNLMEGTGKDTSLTATGEYYLSVLQGLAAKRK